MARQSLVTISAVFSANVQRVLAAHGLTVTAAARRWRMPQKTLEAVVKRLRVPTLDTAERIADGAGFALWQMLAADFDPSNPPVMQPMTPAEREFYRRVRELMAGAPPANSR